VTYTSPPFPSVNLMALFKRLEISWVILRLSAFTKKDLLILMKSFKNSRTLLLFFSISFL
jgi:hypothetical protein